MILHAYSQFDPPDAQTQRRQAVARASWSRQRWLSVPVPDAELPRLFSEGTRKFPFLRDLLDFACAVGDPGDIVVFSNSDIGFVPSAAERIACHMLDHECSYAYRRDFGRLDAPITESGIATGEHYPGTDTFMFRIRWWQAHRTAMPDMLVAREAWDPVLRHVMHASHPGLADLPLICWHERHGGASHWLNPSIRRASAGQQHNLNLAGAFMRQHGIDPKNFGVHP